MHNPPVSAVLKVSLAQRTHLPVSVSKPFPGKQNLQRSALLVPDGAFSNGRQGVQLSASRVSEYVFKGHLVHDAPSLKNPLKQGILSGF